MMGCESLQRKFTRKPKQPPAAPSPIIQFQDYTMALTPLDRYRKHYLMFSYWHDALLDGLEAIPLNSKRFRRASEESLGELNILQGLLTDDLAIRLTPIIEERAAIDHQLQHRQLGEAQARIIWRTLESQERRIHREFYWRDVVDHLAPQPANASTH